MTATDSRLHNLTGEWEINRTDILWNFNNMYNPRVVHDPGAAYPFKMWFFGWAAADNNPGYAGADAIFHARGKSLDHWEVYAGSRGWDDTMNPQLWVPVMTAGEERYDNYHNGDPSVVLHGGMYYMAFSSVGFDRRQADGSGGSDTDETLYIVNCVMGAQSADGIAWTKTAAPIAIWDREYELGWDAADPTPPPQSQGGYHRPSLLFDDGKWRMWFDYYLAGTFLSMGYAENTGDFMSPDQWAIIRAGSDPLLTDWPNPNVIKAGASYVSFADPPGFADRMPANRQIAMAESPDGIHWQTCGYIRPEPGYEGTHVPEAFYYEDGTDKWLYVFYSWQPDTVPYDPAYKSIRYMRKRL